MAPGYVTKGDHDGAFCNFVKENWFLSVIVPLRNYANRYQERKYTASALLRRRFGTVPFPLPVLAGAFLQVSGVGVTVQGQNVSILGWTSDWAARGACRNVDPDSLFVQGAAQNRAKLVCQGCPVRTECLADALDNRIEFGVWGGMTERERRALLRRRSDVTSWRSVLETARDEYHSKSA